MFIYNSFSCFKHPYLEHFCESAGAGCHTQRGLELRWHRSVGSSAGAQGWGRARARATENRNSLL